MIRAGDKTKSESWMFVGYGNHQLTNNWFIRGNLTAGLNSVLSKDIRAGLVSRAKYNMQSYSAEASVGYNYRTLNNMILNSYIRY
jgi:hypothetical protein